MVKRAGHKIVVLVLTFLLAGNTLICQKGMAAELSSNERIAGPTDMDTAIEIALRLNPRIAPAVILASPSSYYDALAAIPFAQQKQAPILWVEPTPQKSDAVFNYIKNYCDEYSTIYILGNNNIIPKSFETALRKLGYKQNQIVRLGGSNHYETAIKIAKNVEYKGNPVIISSGDNNSQIAGISTMAAATESPILFISSKTGIPKSVINYLNSISKKDKISLLIIGDTKAIPKSLVTELKSKVTNLGNDSIVRISGKTPYDLMAKLNAQAWFNESPEDGNMIPISRITLTSGDNYTNAISGAVLAAQNKAPLILIEETMPKSSLKLLKDINHWNEQTVISFQQVTVLGDFDDLSPKAVAEAESLFAIGKTLEGNGQVWTYAKLHPSIDLNYGLIGEDSSFLVTDSHYNTLHVINKNLEKLRLTSSGDVLDEYGKPVGAHKDGFITEAMFNSPSGIANDKEGTLYIADTGNGAIRTIDSNWNVKTLVKGLKHPTGIAINSKGEIFVSETLNHRILKMDTLGNWTVFVGGGYSLIGGEPVGAFADGKGEQAKFNEPQGLALDYEDNLYIADSANQRIRKVNTEGVVSTIAGSGVERIEYTSYIRGGYQDGIGENAKFNFPMGLAVGSDRTIYVADTYNHCIRMITPEGMVSTVAGSIEPGNRNGIATLAQFNHPSDVLIYKDGSFIVLDKGNDLLRVYQPPQ